MFGLWLVLRTIPLKFYFIIAALVAVVGGTYATYRHVANLRATVTRVAYSRDSAQAVSDSTRVINGVYVRRAVQIAQERDSISKALQTERRLNARLTASIPDTKVGGTTVAQVLPDSVILSWKDLRQIPFTVDANVVYVPKDSTAAITVAIKTDPIPLSVRVECGIPLDGVRPASLVVQPVEFMRISIDSVSQSREVCAGETRVHDTPRGISARAALEIGIGSAILGGIVSFLILGK